MLVPYSLLFTHFENFQLDLCLHLSMYVCLMDQNFYIYILTKNEENYLKILIP